MRGGGEVERCKTMASYSSKTKCNGEAIHVGCHKKRNEIIEFIYGNPVIR